MRRSAWSILLLIMGLTCFGQPSYWFQQWQRKPDAKTAQEYFMVPGANMTFTYATNRVILNAAGGGGLIQLTGDVLAGPGASPLATVLKNTGVAGTYTKVTFDAKGRETGGTMAVLASADYLNQGTATTLLHGNAAGNPSWGAVDLTTDVTGLLPNGNLANDSVTYNGQTVALGGSGTLTLGSSDFVNQGTTITVLHGNAAGNPSWSQVNLGTDVTGTLPNLNLANSSVTYNGQTVSLGGSGTLTLASGDFLNQGTTTTLLHGNAAGNPSWAAVNLATDVTGTLPITSVPSYILTNRWQASAGVINLSNQIVIDQSNPNNGLLVRNGTASVTLSNGIVRTTSAAVIGDVCYANNFDLPTGLYERWGTSGSRGAMSFGSIAAVPVNTFELIGGAGVPSAGIAFVSKVVSAGSAPFHPMIMSSTSSVPSLTITTVGNTNSCNLKVNGDLYVTNSATATNFITSRIKWIDIPMNYASTTLGPNAPALTAVTNASVIQELAFDNTDILYAQGQFSHTVAVTNSLFPSFYFEPHVHFTTIGTLDSTHSNVTWRIEWQVAPIGAGWYSGTNSVTYGVAANHTHYMAELGHITNNHPLGISAIFRCRLTRPASVAQDYSNAHDVLLDGFDLHIPIGNQNAIGSSSDNAP